MRRTKTWSTRRRMTRTTSKRKLIQGSCRRWRGASLRCRRRWRASPGGETSRDPATVIKEKCAESDCTKYKERLDECTNRVQSKNKTTETCFEEIIDFYHCVDHCAAEQIFEHVK